MRDLGGIDALAWVVTTYILAATVSTPFYGKLGDAFGRKRIFQLAILVFLTGSILSGAAQTMAQLVVFRAVQGAGAGGLIVGSQTVIAEVVPPRELARYQGFNGATFVLSTMLGPVLGGLFVDGLSWRWIFYANLPLGAVALAIVSVAVPHLRGRGARRLDLLALMPPRLFRNATFRAATIAGFFANLARWSAIVYLPVYFQLVRGMSATRSGLWLLPLMLGVLCASIGSGQAIARVGRYKVFPVTGTALATVGLVLLTRLGADTSLVVVALSTIVLGLGLGMVLQVLVLALQNAVDEEDLGAATATATFFRAIGGAAGVALFGAVFAAGLDAGAAHAVHDVFAVAIPFAAAAFVVTLLLHDLPLRDTTPVPAATEDLVAEPGAAR